MSKITAMCNQKSGIGKTVAAVNLGIGLTPEDKNVLLVDVDAQSSLTASLGHQHPEQSAKALTTVMSRIIMAKAPIFGEGTIHHEEGIDFLHTNIELFDLSILYLKTLKRNTPTRHFLTPDRRT